MPAPLAIQASSLPATHIEASYGRRSETLVASSKEVPAFSLRVLARLSSRILRCYATATSLIRGWAFTCRSLAGLYMRLPSAWAMEAALCGLTLGSSAGVWGTHLTHTTCCSMVAIPRNPVHKSKFCQEQFWGELNSDAVSFSAMAFTAAEKQSCGLQLDGFHPL